MSNDLIWTYLNLLIRSRSMNILNVARIVSSLDNDMSANS